MHEERRLIVHLAVLRGLVLGDLHEVLLELRRRLPLDLQEPLRRHGQHLKPKMHKKRVSLTLTVYHVEMQMWIVP